MSKGPSYSTRRPPSKISSPPKRGSASHTSTAIWRSPISVRRSPTLSGHWGAAIRVGNLNDSNLIARRVGPVHGRLVASPDLYQRGSRDAGRPPYPSGAHAENVNLAIQRRRQDNFQSSAGAVQSGKRHRSSRGSGLNFLITSSRAVWISAALCR